VAPGANVTAPTAEEALRVKAYLVVQRNAVRDYLDVVALADHIGVDRAGEILRHIDDYYDDRSQQAGSVRTSLALALADPKPVDVDVIAELPRYRGLDPRWHDWSSVVASCRDLALEVAEA
jgi:predicted nucleotidyltransferase component of viral defense system